MHVPLVDVAAQDSAVADEALAAVAAVAKEGRFVLGPRVEAFERWLADASAAKHAVGVASGTDAIELSLRGLGVGPGDAVVTPAFSFVAGAEAIAAAGARPVFCDIDPTTLAASAETVGDAIDRTLRSGLCVRAIVAVHLFGAFAPIERMVASGRNVLVVEDAAQALGARDGRGRPARRAMPRASASSRRKISEPGGTGAPWSRPTTRSARAFVACGFMGPRRPSFTPRWGATAASMRCRPPFCSSRRVTSRGGSGLASDWPRGISPSLRAFP
jgi:hypothetical protein